MVAIMKMQITFENFSLREPDDRAVVSSEAPSPVATDNNKPQPGGRPNAIMANHQARGKEIREHLTGELHGSGRSRPLQ